MEIGEYLLMPKARRVQLLPRGYAAPELLSDKPVSPAADKPVSPEADYYSLGVIVIECLTGMSPENLPKDHDKLLYDYFYRKTYPRK